MGNRRLPFGYHLKMALVEIYPLEAETVRRIFRDYLSGASLSELSDRLNSQPIRYDGQRNWNKNMVARILNDARYTGEGGFPEIIGVSDFRGAAELKASRSQFPSRTEAEKAVRQLSGQRVTSRIMREVLKLLNGLSKSPECITSQDGSASSTAAVSLRRDLDKTLSCFPLDEDRAKLLAMQYATALYEATGSGEYETERLRRIFSGIDPMDSLDVSLLRSCVSEITIHRNGTVSLTLKNHQVIGVDKNA